MLKVKNGVNGKKKVWIFFYLKTHEYLGQGWCGNWALQSPQEFWFLPAHHATIPEMSFFPDGLIQQLLQSRHPKESKNDKDGGQKVS